LLLLQIANVVFIQIKIDESAQPPLLVVEVFAKIRMLCDQGLQRPATVAAETSTADCLSAY